MPKSKFVEISVFFFLCQKSFEEKFSVCHKKIAVKNQKQGELPRPDKKN